MTPHQFIAKWQAADLSERSAYQQHFLDLCELLGEPKPAEADPMGLKYTFEKGIDKETGGKGFADVWKKDCFGWEYKGKRKNLADAFRQLSQYREALANPPLLIVCDLNRFEIHTNFTGTIKEVHAFDLEGLAEPANLAKLRYAFQDPYQLKPGRTPQQVTEEVAGEFAKLADGMWKRGVPADKAAHFLMKLMFCMFAEDIDLLPKNLFLDTVKASKEEPKRLSKLLADLFDKMAHGGDFGLNEIARFNGGLFADAEVVELTKFEIQLLIFAAGNDWSNVEPSIFGTLFERTLNPEKRSQLGAHYTSRADIETLLNPVMMDPLHREWDAVRTKADKLYEKAKGSKSGSKPKRDFEKAIDDFLFRLAHVTVLDPACGSGNFLYVAIHLLLTLEKEVIAYANARNMSILIPGVRPTQLRGIEINPTAQQLAQVVIWIGYLQWMKFNGFVQASDPVLDPMETIACRDAILDLSDPANPKEPDWPDSEFIVGNPPFLGDKKMRGELGHEYVVTLRKLYDGRLPGQSDLVCYWFEKARAMIEEGRVKRAGLIGTQNIRGGASRRVLERIARGMRIFFAVSDRKWLLDGATVHISIVGFDAGNVGPIILDGQSVPAIHANLKNASDTTLAKSLVENRDLAFIGNCKGGPFDMPWEEALPLLQPAGNPNKKPNSDVLRPVMNSREIMGSMEGRWIIDFAAMESAESASYHAPFRMVVERVKPQRDDNRDAWLKANWWRPQRMRPEMRRGIADLERFLVTPTTSKHRIFAWVRPPVLPDHKLVVFARQDDYFFGILQSRIHEVWARQQGTQLRDRESALNYNVEMSFLSFPFPAANAAQKKAIAAAAKELENRRNDWLNPTDFTKTEVLEFPGSADGPWKRYVHDADKNGIGTVKYPRIVPKNADCAIKLKKRTLTNLYNERPTWLANVHRKLDEAVAAAYGWPADLSDDELLAKLLALNLERSKV